MAVAHLARIADRDPLELPIGGDFFHFFDQLLGRELLAGRELFLVRLAGLPNLDVGAADVDDEDVHGAQSQPRS